MAEKKLKLSKGSALVFSLIILSLILAIALGMISVSVKETKMSQTTERSTQSFQSADSAAEVMIQKIYNDDTLDSIYSLTSKISGANCYNGIVSGTMPSGESYSVVFNDSNDPPNVLDCSESIYDIGKIKSAGAKQQTARAIEFPIVGDIDSGKFLWFNFDSDGDYKDYSDTKNDAFACTALNYTSSNPPVPNVNSNPDFLTDPISGRKFISFNNGSNKNCAIIDHDINYELPSGTISFWMRYRQDPFSTSDNKSVIVKDANDCDKRTDRDDVSSAEADLICHSKTSYNGDGGSSYERICDCGHVGFRFNYPTSGDFGARFQNDGNGSHYVLDNDLGKVSAGDWNNVWHHVVLTFDSKKYTLYIDGKKHDVFEKADDEDQELEALTGNDWKFYLGGVGYPDGGPSSIWSQSDIDDLRMYNRALSKFEVRKLFDKTKL